MNTIQKAAITLFAILSATTSFAEKSESQKLKDVEKIVSCYEYERNADDSSRASCYDVMKEIITSSNPQTPEQTYVSCVSAYTQSKEEADVRMIDWVCSKILKNSSNNR